VVNVLDKRTIERVAQHYYDDARYDQTVFSNTFRQPIVRRGYMLKSELVTVVTWKAARQKGNAARNAAVAVEDVTREAFAAHAPAVAVSALSRLHGVRARMASAVLTVYDPVRYTVMDVRAWASLVRLGYLEPRTHFEGADTYATYLNVCQTIAGEHDVALRTLDRCLWALGGRTPGELSEAEPQRCRKRPERRQGA